MLRSKHTHKDRSVPFIDKLCSVQPKGLVVNAQVDGDGCAVGNRVQPHNGVHDHGACHSDDRKRA